MTEHQCARTLIESDIEIATAIRAVPASTHTHLQHSC